MTIKTGKSGKINIPKVYLDEIGIKDNEELTIFTRVDEIVIKKQVFECVFCANSLNLTGFGKFHACRSCIERLYNAKVGDYLYRTIQD